MVNGIELRIVFNPKSGEVQLKGPIDHPLWCFGALEEAKRIIARRANERDSAAQNPLDGLIIAGADSLPPPPRG